MIKIFAHNIKAFLQNMGAMLLLLICATNAWASTTSSLPPPSCIWHADHNAIYQIQSGSNQAIKSIPLKNTRALAMNGKDCGVWVVTDKQLYQYDADAIQVFNVTLQSLNKKLRHPDQIIIDPYDNSIWLVEDKTLFHLGASGQLIGSWDAAGKIRMIAFALDRSVWVLGNKQLWHVSAQGNLLAERDLHKTIQAEPKLLLFDSLAGLLWLAGEKQLTQLNINQPEQAPLQIDLPHPLTAFALNPLKGEVWLATTENQLCAWGRDGKKLLSINLGG